MTVVLPFYGPRDEADRVLRHLDGLALRSGDAAVVVDNTPGAQAHDQRVVLSPVKRSAYAARNIGAELARTPWLLFVDADCRLPADLLDRYFVPPPDDGDGALAGQVVGAGDQPGLIPAYIRSREHLDQVVLSRHPYRPMAVTANLLVRRAAWAAVGGFQEHTRSGADADFCWRLLDAGWGLGLRTEAAVEHDHRATLAALLAQTRRDGAGAPWLARRHPDYGALFDACAFARAAVGAAAWPLLGQPRRGLFKALDAVWGAAFDIGALASNAAPSDAPPPAVVAVVREFPRRDDPLVAALAALAEPVHVEAARRPTHPDWPAARALEISYWEDDGLAARLGGRVGRRATGPLAPAATRVAAAAPGARLLAEPGRERLAARLAALARRSDLNVERL